MTGGRRTARSARRPGAGAGVLGLLAALAASPTAGAAEGGGVRFERDVAPVLARHCVRCHRPDRKKGGLSLARAADLEAAGVVVPGKPEESDLIAAVAPAEGGGRPDMPKGAPPLSAGQVESLRRWVAEGAVWPEGVVVTEAARAGAEGWAFRRLAAAEPPDPAGLPPGWAANPIDRFVYAALRGKGLRPSPPADPRTLIRRLAYDLTGLPPTPEEVEAFARDARPDAYERLVDRLLSSPRYGEHWGRHWLDVVRFGESRGYERNEIIPNAWPFRDYVIRAFNEDVPFDRLVAEHLAGDVVGKDRPGSEVGTGFLVGGPYDDVGNQDAAQAAVIRANTLDDIIRATSEAFLGLTVGCARCHDHKFDPIPTRDYYALYATFAGVRHGSRPVASGPGPAGGAPPSWWVGTFEPAPGPFHVFLGGDPQRKGSAVAPGGLSTLGPDDTVPAGAPESARRLALARWIIGPAGPLAARVLANRIWQYHFGTGIVDTPSDFGAMGGLPTHPELLDWLARRLVDGGWRLKPVHRLIVTSRAYRQSSAYREGAARVDAAGRWLWRFPPRRLAAEEVRDTLLTVAGVLDPSMGGPGFRLYQYLQDNVATYVPLDAPGPETYRRAVYHHSARASYVDVLTDFDCPDNALGAPRRASTTTPLQALTMMNHRFSLDTARAFAARLAREAGPDPAAQVRRAFALAFHRAPDPAELADATALIARFGLPAFCRAVWNANELIYLD